MNINLPGAEEKEDSKEGLEVLLLTAAMKRSESVGAAGVLLLLLLPPPKDWLKEFPDWDPVGEEMAKP